MYYINEVFLRSIHRIWGMTQRQFSTAVFDSLQQWDKRMRNFDNMLVTDIIKIANFTHVPIRYFFTEHPNGKTYTRNDAEMKGDWHTITINMEGMHGIYTGTEYDYDRTKMLDTVGLGVTAFWKWLQPGASFNMKATTLCDICNTYGIDLQDAITDPNEAIPVATKPRTDGTLRSANARLERRLKAHEKKLDTLVSEVKKVIKERDNAIEESARLRAKNRYRPDTTEVIMTVEESDHPRWSWQPSQWQEKEIPTLADLISYCNKHNRPTLPFLSFSQPTNTEDDPTFTTITIDYMAYSMLAKSLGITETPDQLLAHKFCRILEENSLTPACCINDPNSNYKTTFPDRMVRALGSAGITA